MRAYYFSELLYRLWTQSVEPVELKCYSHVIFVYCSTLPINIYIMTVVYKDKIETWQCMHNGAQGDTSGE